MRFMVIMFPGEQAEVGVLPDEKIIGGFWTFQVKSKEEAIEWAKRCPALGDEMIEIRQVYKAENFGPAFTPDLQEAEERLCEQVAS